MNSKQSARYIKRRMGNDLKQKILVQNGIISEQQIEKKPSILNCPKCSLINAIENKYCSKCSYPLVPSAFDEIKAAEDEKIQALETKYEQVNSAFQNILTVLGSVNQAGKNEIAKQLIQKGLYRTSTSSNER
jgi:RNase P subunit RPR2